MAIAGGRIAGARVDGGSVTTGRVAQSTEAQGARTLLALAPASTLGAGTDVPSYWAARSGRALSTYWGAYVLLGDADYLWWSHEGSQDPGLWVAALSGLTGHQVTLAAGNRTAEQVATETAAVLGAITGWSSTQAVGELTVAGPAAVTVGPAWDDGDPGSMIGMRSITVAGSPIEGPVTTVIAQHLPSVGAARPIVAVDVYLGSAAVVGDRWRVALYAATGGTTTPTGEARLVDLGQVPTAAIGTNRWARIPMPAGTIVLANQAMWATIKGNVGTTQVGGRLSGDPLIGDWTSQQLREANGGGTPISTDPTVAWPSTFGETTGTAAGFVCGVRLVVASSTHDASHHSSADRAIWGTHVAPGGLGSTIDLNSHLLMVAPSPPFLGMVVGGEGWAVGAVRGTQPRLGVMTGGSAVEPVDPDGATLLVDGGRLTGSSTTAWEDVSHTPVAWPANTATAWIAKCNDDATGTNIAFAQDPAQANASPADAPMDWLPAASSPGPFGSEYEIFPADSAYNDTDPANPFASPFVADPDDARPRNVPGARILWWIPGITATPL